MMGPDNLPGTAVGFLSELAEATAGMFAAHITESQIAQLHALICAAYRKYRNGE
jgi:hypothetical protein